MKKAMLTTTILLAALMSGAGVAAAAPPFAGPTDIVAPTVPPEPEPCEVKHVACDFTLPTLVEQPTDIVNPTVNPDPTVPTGPTDIVNPTVTDEPTEPPTTTSPQPPVEQPKNPPSGVPTPNRIETGEGPAAPVNWWLIVVPLLALLGLAAAGAYLVVQRSERRPS